MNRDEIIEKFTGILAEVRIIRDDTDSPAIEASARQIEMQCHLALSCVGFVELAFPGVVDEGLESGNRARPDRV